MALECEWEGETEVWWSHWVGPGHSISEQEENQWDSVGIRQCYTNNYVFCAQ